MNPFHYLMPTEVVFGVGALEGLATRAAALGTKALLVTGQRAARASGALRRAYNQLPNPVIFEGVEENPETDVCEEGAAICRKAGCDMVVGLGGGSAMDVAKAVAALARNPEPCAALFGSEKLKHGNLPVIAIPTTAGTGSEVTPYAVLINPSENAKQTIGARSLFPAIALLDPELTVTMPRDVTVATGLDVLSQAMEGMVSLKSTPLGDILALEACRLVKRHLVHAADCGDDIEARAGMLYASMLAGCVIAQSGTTLVHGMGYYFTLEFGVAHGLANGLLLTPLFRHNARHLPEKVAMLASVLGVPSNPTPKDASAAIANAIHALFEELDVSPAARDAGVDSHRFKKAAKTLFADPYRFRNQVGEISEDEILDFFEQAYEGTW